jgi:zinc transport system permease protein
MIDLITQPFMQRVLAAALLTSLVAGVIGSYVVVKRMASVTGGLAHAAFGGVGLGYVLGFDPMLGAAGFTVLSGLGVGFTYRRFRSALDTSISMAWSAGMALGVILVALSPGYAPDLTSYLFGNILFVSWDYVAWVGALDLVILLVVVFFHDLLSATSFDEEYSEVMGLPVERLVLLLLTLVSLAVVTLIRVVGVIMAIALLTVPAATARQWATSMRGMMVLGTLLAAVYSTGGLIFCYWLSVTFQLSVPPGPVIVLGALAAFALSSLLSRLKGTAGG